MNKQKAQTHPHASTYTHTCTTQCRTESGGKPKAKAKDSPQNLCRQLCYATRWFFFFLTLKYSWRPMKRRDLSTPCEWIPKGVQRSAPCLEYIVAYCMCKPDTRDSEAPLLRLCTVPTSTHSLPPVFGETRVNCVGVCMCVHAVSPQWNTFVLYIAWQCVVSICICLFGCVLCILMLCVYLKCLYFVYLRVLFEVAVHWAFRPPYKTFWILQRISSSYQWTLSSITLSTH